MANEELYMRRCLYLAQLANGNTAPNPMVGAVLVHNDRIIAEGYHRVYGGDHAEVDCLNRVTEADRKLIPESILYVNLEPCAHHGKTPPCANRIVAEGIRKVVVANTDPFAAVSGKGIALLQASGIAVVTGVLAAEGAWLNRRFFCYHTAKRPYIVLKWAQTREGFFAPPDKTRHQITGATAQLLLHKWRTEEAGIMVGATTARNDNPELTARLWQGRQPLRIVLNRKLDLPRTNHVFSNDAPTWIINELEDSDEGNVRFVKLAFDKWMLDNLLQQLHQHHVLSVMVEGGAELLTSFFRAGLWDEARLLTGDVSMDDGLQAPLITGGTHVFATHLEHDSLQIFLNRKNPYRFVPDTAIM